MKSDIAVLFDSKEFLIFNLTGAEMLMVTKNNAKEQFLKAVKTYKLILISETLAKLLEEEIKVYEGKLSPIILSLHSPKGESGWAVKNLSKKAKTSLGLEI